MQPEYLGISDIGREYAVNPRVISDLIYRQRIDRADGTEIGGRLCFTRTHVEAVIAPLLRRLGHTKHTASAGDMRDRATDERGIGRVLAASRQLNADRKARIEQLTRQASRATAQSVREACSRLADVERTLLAADEAFDLRVEDRIASGK